MNTRHVMGRFHSFKIGNGNHFYFFEKNATVGYNSEFDETLNPKEIILV